MLARLSLVAASIVVAIAAVGVILLEALQTNLVYMPDRIIHATPASIGLRYLDVRFTTADGITLDGWFVPAPDATATFLVCHGNAGNISTRLDAIEHLHSLDANVFIFDYRGYGRSGGRPSETGTYLDADAAYRWLRDHTVDTGGAPIVVMGRSLGGPIAAHLSMQYPVAALILEATFPSIRALVAARTGIAALALLSRYNYDTLAYLARSSCPLLVAQSVDDRVVPYALGRGLERAARPPKMFFPLRGPHDSGFQADGPRYVSAIAAFLRTDAGLREIGRR